MEPGKNLFRLFLFSMIFCISCNTEIRYKILSTERKPEIKPDYSEVTIPPNIAPMNFRINENGNYFRIIATSGAGGIQFKLKSTDGIVRFPEKTWKKLLKDSRGDTIKILISLYKNDEKVQEQFDPVYMYVSDEPIDPYLAYRMIYPGYYSWSHIKIMQRSIESFSEESLIENQILDMNCVNCHSFNNHNPGKFLVHIRGSEGGTYFVEDGKITRRDLKIDAMPGGATYPSWHPNGRFVAFSSNQVRQQFYSHPSKTIEVFDLVSSLILFDSKNNDILLIRDSDTTRYLKTFPSWSTDGKYLYFCRAPEGKSTSNMSLDEIKSTKYDLVRIPFDPETRSFGETEIVFKASEQGKSVSFPRVSPDGKYLVFTMDDFGTFPIWHKEADLWLLDLQSGDYKKMDLNSNETESYHTWSSNGKWLVFSSRRLDGRSTRPFFAYIGSWEHSGKPFVLPQKDPGRYDALLESLSIPEFVSGRIKVTPRDFASGAKHTSIKANPGNPLDSLPLWEIQKINAKRNPGEKSIHE
jgi:hypothetical protein